MTTLVEPGKEVAWSGFGNSMKEATVVPLGLRGRGVSVPGEELSKQMRQELMVFADGPIPSPICF
jgi:hypothetical protein